MVSTVYAASMLKLQFATQKRKDIDLTVLMPSGDALITRSRQDLVAHFLGMPTATHLLFVDSDIGFETEQVFRFLDFGEGVTAGVYPTNASIGNGFRSWRPKAASRWIRLRSRMSWSSRTLRRSRRGAVSPR